MIADYNLNVVVFDDEYNEAKPLIEALNYERIPNVFINLGDERNDRKLQNIRIIFADLVFGTQVLGDNTIEHIRTRILDNISDDNGPFILVAWSKHLDLAKTLEEKILQIKRNFKFLTITLDKNDYFEIENDKYVLKEGMNFNTIRQDIISKIEKLKHLELFLEWEGDVKKSISKVLNNFLSDINDTEKVNKEISATIKYIIGKQEDLSNTDKFKAFYKTMNTVLGDSMEINPENKVDKYADLFKSLNFETFSSDEKAKINAEILFEKITDENKSLKNGNIYSFNEFKEYFGDDIIKNLFKYSEEDIFKDVFEFHAKHKLFDKNNEESQNDFENRHLNNYESLSHPIILEFTPSCDITQNKLKKSRLIFGFLLDSKYKHIKKQNESLYITPFHFKLENENLNLDSNYRLVLFIKTIFAVNPDKIREMRPIIRARKELVVDLQHAIANHISRVGVSSINGDDNDSF
ncbi:MAG: hypothetical protein IJ211_03535 [Campylobacter sp.]|nr:hypothetical protein [Campylobacter sp.]